MIEPDDQRHYHNAFVAIADIAGRQDPEGFAQIVREFERAWDVQLRHAGSQVRKTYGAAAVGRALGITKSAAVQRYPLPKEETS